MNRLQLYRHMFRARAFELAQADLWRRGLISGELHLGTGEEAVAAGLCCHLKSGDALALDHRGTPVLTILGVDLVLMLKEMLGRSDGLCRGRGGHMHLFSRKHLAAASGIVGAAGPLAAGLGLSAKKLRPGSAALAFFGDGAMNQGMLLESFNLAAAWKLPVVFVCKNNGWAITTRSSSLSGGDPVARARGFGLETHEADGLDPVEVSKVAGWAVAAARRGSGPQFLHLPCTRLDGHLLGDPMIRMARSPLSEGRDVFGSVISAVLSRRGGDAASRAASLVEMTGLLARSLLDGRDGGRDPLTRTRRALGGDTSEIVRMEEQVLDEVSRAVAEALGEEEA